jgi:hypothetical protein
VTADAGQWLREVTAVAVLANLLQPFTTAAVASAQGGFDDDDSDEERRQVEARKRLALCPEETAEAVSLSQAAADRGRALRKARAQARADAKAAADAAAEARRAVGRFEPEESVGGYLEQLQAHSFYDVTEAAARFGPTPSLRTVTTGAAGSLGGKADDVALAQLRGPLPRRAAPCPSRFEGNPYVAASLVACAEWKLNGPALVGALSEATSKTADRMKELMLTAFQYEPPAVQSERELRVMVRAPFFSFCFRPSASPSTLLPRRPIRPIRLGSHPVVRAASVRTQTTMMLPSFHFLKSIKSATQLLVLCMTPIFFFLSSIIHLP